MENNTAVEPVSAATQAISDIQEVLTVLKEHNIKPTELRQRLESPPMTVMNIQMFLNQCTKEQLAMLFYTSGLVKLAEIAKQSHENQQQEPKQRDIDPV